MAFRSRHKSRSVSHWCFFCLLLAGTQLSAQALKLVQFDHKVWATRDGAPAPINDIALNHDGTLWLATLKGLYTFDGLHFDEFHAAPGSRALPVGGYETVLEARNGDVWVGSVVKGIARIHQGQVTIFSKAEGFPDLTVLQIIEAPDGAIWAVVNGAAMMLNGNRWLDGGTLGGIPHEGGVKAIFFDREGTQWISTARSVYFRARGQVGFTGTDVTYQHGQDTTNFVETQNGDLWVAIVYNSPVSGSDLRKLDVPGHRTSTPQTIQVPGIMDEIYTASDGSLWLTGVDIHRFSNTDSAQSAIVEETFGLAQGLSGRRTSTALEDGRGDLWLATNIGLERFQVPKLVRYVDRPLDSPNLGLARDVEGTIWIGSDGLPLLSVRGGLTIEHGPPVTRASVLLPDRSGSVWAKSDLGLFRMSNNQLISVPVPTGYAAWSPRQLFESSTHEIYLFCSAPSRVFRWNQNAWIPIELPGQPEEAPLSFFFDRQDRLWIGYVSGKVGMVDQGSGRVFAVGTGADLSTIESFAETSEGLLCSGFNGIALFHDGRFRPLPTRTPFAVETASGMVQTHNGDLWLNGLHGVSRIAGSDLHAAITQGRPMPVKLYQQTEVTGPAPQTFGFPSAVAGADGRLWFNTSGTIVSLDPDHMPQDPLAPVLTITGLEQDEQPVGSDHTIKADAGTVRIPYFGADLYAPDQVIYRYRLQGVDRDWQDVAHRTEAVYTHLNPGRYLFQVQAMSGEGVWSQPVVTAFTVLPRFYQTLWFTVLAALFCVLTLYLAYYWRVLAISRRMQDRAEAKADERLRIARDLHDTLLQGFQGLMLSFETGTKLVPLESPAHRILNRALCRAEDVLVESRVRFQDLRVGSKQAADLPGALQEAGDDLNRNRPIRFTVETTGPAHVLDPNVSDEVYLIAREAIRNAFTHANASEIRITFDFRRDSLLLSIADDGSGMDAPDVKSKLSPHFGLIGMKERAERINAELAILVGPSGGTSVLLTVRFRKPGRLFSSLLRWIER